MEAFDHLTVGDALVVLGGLVAVGAAIRKAWPAVRDFVLGVVELVGAPARGTRPARPGLLARVEQLAHQMDEQGHRLTRVEETAEAAASAASAANGRLDHVSAQVSEVRDLAEETRDQAQALAAEQTQIRAALEELRGAAGTDASTLHDPGTTD